MAAGTKYGPPLNKDFATESPKGQLEETTMKCFIFGLILSLSCVLNVRAQSPIDLPDPAKRDFLNGDMPAAERDLRALAKQDGSNVVVQLYLGHTLFRQEKYPDAIVSYEKARSLEASGKRLPEDHHRVLIDQLVMSYGISGQLKKAQQLVDDAIRKDPDYPMNYYNLACIHAEQGEKQEMLSSLLLTYQHRDRFIKGEQMPDPRSDPSFKNYVRDPDFVALMKKLGYK